MPPTATPLLPLRKEHYSQHVVPQVGPVCAAASVSGALNVLNGLRPGDPGRFRVRDTMRAYQIMFSNKREEALWKLSKVVKTSDVQATTELFHEQAICLAARGRNSKLFLDLLRTAVVKAVVAAEEGSERKKLMTMISDAVEQHTRPASALVIDRLKM